MSPQPQGLGDPLLCLGAHVHLCVRVCVCIVGVPVHVCVLHTGVCACSMHACLCVPVCAHVCMCGVDTHMHWAARLQ